MSVNAITSAASPILAPQGIRTIENTPAGAGSFGAAMTDALNGVESSSRLGGEFYEWRNRGNS